MTDRSSQNKPLWIKLSVVATITVIVICLVLLGNWQMRRLHWKLDLIENVKTRAYSAPVQLPTGPITDKDHSYTRVIVSGSYMLDRTTLVKAVTELGPGFWVMTPLSVEGQQPKQVWINRGFVPQKFKSQKHWVLPTQDKPLIGLLRITEPKGTYLEKNNAKNNKWFSRDIKALSKHAELDNAAPYFIDLENSSKNPDWPRAGLTILKFRNNHLPYALTWYSMALLLTLASIWVAREL